MAFDEKGQADTIQRKVAISERAYKLLTEPLDFPPEDIIFDPNIFAVATGIEEHNRYSLDFIEATAKIKELMPAVQRERRREQRRRSRSAATIRCARPCIRCSCTTRSARE